MVAWPFVYWSVCFSSVRRLLCLLNLPYALVVCCYVQLWVQLQFFDITYRNHEPFQSAVCVLAIYCITVFVVQGRECVCVCVCVKWFECIFLLCKHIFILIAVHIAWILVLTAWSSTIYACLWVCARSKKRSIASACLLKHTYTLFGT